MLQLLSPAGLWALAALALPLAIHLWRPPPKNVRLGSLRFLDHLPHRHLRNLRWRERALLAVRLALLAALALLLAGPRWMHPPPTGPQRWALLDPTAAVSGGAADRLRQLRADGYALHRLAPGLPSIDSPARVDFSESSLMPPDLWSLLREADAALPAGSTLAVFTPGRLVALRGARPSLAHSRVDWIATPDAAGTAAQSWIESLQTFAPPGKAGDARALVGTSDASSTRFADVSPAPAPGASTGPAVEFSSDRSRARLGSSVPGPWAQTAKAPSALRLAILHDPDRTADARSVEAAARACAAVAGRPLAITTRPLDERAGPDSLPAADWMFWLSARPVPPADGVANLVSDAGAGARDDPASTEGWIVAPPGTPGSAALAVMPVRLWRRVPAALPLPDNVETLWTDSGGDPLLTLERVPGKHRWRFYSRFDPDWTDLPRTAAMPAMIGGLIFPPAATFPTAPAHDLRLADPSQNSLALSPIAASAPMPVRLTLPEAVDLHWPLWMLAAALFILERLLSRRAISRGATALQSPAPAFAR